MVDQLRQAPSQTVIKLHAKLQKAEYSVLVQLGTERFGLAYFLYKVGLPGYESSLCSFRQANETVRPFLLCCQKVRALRAY